MNGGDYCKSMKRYRGDQTKDSRNTEVKKCEIRDQLSGLEGRGLIVVLGSCIRTIPPRGLQWKEGGGGKARN